MALVVPSKPSSPSPFGVVDAYPFVLSPSVVAKLRFVDDVVGRAKAGSSSLA